MRPAHLLAGSHLQFGKLTMTGTDLELVDLDPRDAETVYADRIATVYSTDAEQIGPAVNPASASRRCR